MLLPGALSKNAGEGPGRCIITAAITAVVLKAVGQQCTVQELA
jgi:hypothetical protein